MTQSELKPGTKVTVNESDAMPFQAIVRSVHGTMVYLEGSATPAYIGNVKETK